MLTIREIIARQMVVNFWCGREGNIHVLSVGDGTNGGLEGLLQLPVDLIVDHVEEDDSLVAHRDVTVAHELNEQLLY